MQRSQGVTGVIETHFRARGRRLTPQRALLCRLLDGNTEHLPAEAIHRRAQAEMPTLSLRTVYSILHEMVEIGAGQSLDLGTGSARFDPNPHPHHHAVCVKCGHVRDVHAVIPDIELPPDQRRGFWVRGVDVVFRGVCGACRR
jgi:Fe2+ or Zn2+ uptake regulation protein